MNALLDSFRELGKSASFHYADDSGSEWGAARHDEAEAMKIYHAHPELKSEFEAIAENFLWDLKPNLARMK